MMNTFSEIGANIQETMDECNIRFKELEMLKKSVSLFNDPLGTVNKQLKFN